MRVSDEELAMLRAWTKRAMGREVVTEVLDDLRDERTDNAELRRLVAEMLPYMPLRPNHGHDDEGHRRERTMIEFAPELTDAELLEVFDAGMIAIGTQYPEELLVALDQTADEAEQARLIRAALCKPRELELLDRARAVVATVTQEGDDA